MRYQNSIRKSPKGVTRNDLFDDLLSSLGVDAESDVELRLNELLQESPTWEREILSVHLCMKTYIHEEPREEKAWALTSTVSKAIEALPTREKEEVGAERVRLEFRKVITASNEISGETKERLLRFLSAPFDCFEENTRAMFGLVPAEHKGRSIPDDKLPPNFRTGNRPMV